MSGQLTPQQLQVGRMIYGLALSRGLNPQQAREVVAASYAESGLNPRAVNKHSGAAGLFQLLSPGYRTKAQSLGGLFNPRANTLAILGDYANFFHSHPGAAPGEAGAAVERSGQGAGFYASPLALLGGLSGGAPAPSAPAGPPSVPPQPQNSPGASQGPNPALTQALLGSLMRTQEHLPLRLGLPSPAQTTSASQPVSQASSNAGQRAHTSRTPISFTKVIGYPYQGTHTLGNWQSDNAVDLAAPQGTPVYAAFGGTIGSNFGSQGRGGRFAGDRVEVDGADNAAWYGHLSRLVVKPGQRVKAGQLLGYSGEANGVAHLHFAVRNGDPRRYVG